MANVSTATSKSASAVEISIARDSQGVEKTHDLFGTGNALKQRYSKTQTFKEKERKGGGGDSGGCLYRDPGRPRTD